ncbi:DUF2274 domain-containing protein [Stenotrophomonas maltophilia]|uniref:DUF2274 domain-containing protein n=1 Tax=Stenotrophomonas maltophilia TaxID=40324 RepID=UPI0013125346
MLCKRSSLQWPYSALKLAYKPTEANKTFGVLRKMFNLAEVWGYRPDGTNPCRHVPMYPPGKETRLIVDEEMVRIFRHLEKLEAEGLENYVIPLAIRLQFEFAARRSEICPLEWSWLDFENRRVVWPDSKVGGISKPMSEEAYRLLSTAPRRERCPYVLPSTASVKVTFSCPASLKADLDRYAALHSQAYGEAVDAATLVPHMLQAFIDADREFRRSQRS